MFSTTPKKKKLLVTIICLVLALMIVVPALVYADNDFGLGQTAGAANLKSNQELPVIIGNIIYVILGFLGVVFFILVLFGGFTWMTAQGKGDQVSKAVDIVKNAALGLIIVLASYAVTSFILNSVLESSGFGGGQHRACMCVETNACTAGAQDGYTIEDAEDYCGITCDQGKSCCCQPIGI